MALSMAWLWKTSNHGRKGSACCTTSGSDTSAHVPACGCLKLQPQHLILLPTIGSQTAAVAASLYRLESDHKRTSIKSRLILTKKRQKKKKKRRKEETERKKETAILE